MALEPKMIKFNLVTNAIFTCACFLSFASSRLEAQSVNTAREFAVVTDNKNVPAKKVKIGAKIFQDANYSFAVIPPFLKDMYYLETSVYKSNIIIPITEGFVYMVTPLSGQNGSQENQLIELGFVQTDQSSFTLINDQKIKIGVFRKFIAYDKFRLGHIKYNGWAIPFFRKRQLASVEISAKYLWMPKDKYLKDSRKWQGCPSIEITGKRMWGAWFSGGEREPDSGNYGIVSYSDNRKKWVDPALIIFHPDSNVRVMDTQLWKDPQGRLWIFWTQNMGQKGFDGLWGTWAISTGNPESNNPRWTSPRRLCDGLTRNKPIVLSSGEWLLPSYNWVKHQSAMYVSSDNGKNWKLQGGALNDMSDNFYEQMCVELKNGNIWMLQRNIQQSISKNKGITWSGLDTVHELTSANSRLYIGRLRSGRLLMIYNNDSNNKRKNLTAFLSPDEGKSWPYQLLLDERENVSYPDVVQDLDNRIYVCYDRSRTGEKEILMATFKEEEIIKGIFESASTDKMIMISKVEK
jgi:hypothetical protein